MGIFSNAETMYAPVNVPMAEGYDDDQYSAQMAMIESYQNSYARICYEIWWSNI